MRGAWHVLSYLGVWSLGLFSSTFFSTSSKKKSMAMEVAPDASLHSEALSPECGREHQETGDCGPTRHVGAGPWGLLGLTAHGLLG